MRNSLWSFLFVLASATTSARVIEPGLHHDLGSTATATAAANANATTWAFVGDSITYGSCSSDPATKSFPSELSEMMLWGSEEFSVLNFGV